MLEMVVESGSPTAMMIQRSDAEGLSGLEEVIVTPELASQALKAKKHEQQADGLAKMGRYREAIKEYIQAIHIAPYEDEILYMSLGAMYTYIDDYPEALKYLEIAHKINPDNERVAMNLQGVREYISFR
jgi:tetratricopeptide (TPR) repeat protein